MYVYTPDTDFNSTLVGIVESTTRHKLSARNLSDPLMEVNEMLMVYPSMFKES